MRTLYESILSLCQEKGIKGGKMCVELGLSKSLLTDLKFGRKKGITAATAQKIAEYFDVSIDRVLGQERPSFNNEQLSENDAKEVLFRAAFFEGGENLSEAEKDALWEDAKSYMRFKMNEKKRGSHEQTGGAI